MIRLMSNISEYHTSFMNFHYCFKMFWNCSRICLLNRRHCNDFLFHCYCRLKFLPDFRLNLFWHVPMDLLILVTRTVFGNSSIWLSKFLWNSYCHLYLFHIEINSLCYRASCPASHCNDLYCNAILFLCRMRDTLVLTMRMFQSKVMLCVKIYLKICMLYFFIHFHGCY